MSEHIYIGDAKTFRCYLTLASTGAAADLTGAKVWATLGNASGVVATLKMSVPGEVDLVGPATDGCVDVKVVEAHSLLLTPAGPWTLEVVAELADGHERTAGRQTITSIARQTPAIT